MASAEPKNINTVDNITSIDEYDYLLVSDQASALRKVNSNAVSKYAVETYTTTLGGVNNKTVQSAINDLNSNFIYATSVDDLCTNILALPSNRTATLYITSTVTSALINVNMVGKGYVSKVSNAIADIIIYAGANGELYTIRINPTTKVVSTDNTTKLPTRAEVDALSSNLDGLVLEYKGRLEVTGSTGDSIAITSGVGAHFIHIVACGMWNSSVLLAVFPANGGEPRVKVIATYSNSETPDIPVTITANGNYGLTITNTTSNTCPITVYAIKKAN